MTLESILTALLPATPAGSCRTHLRAPRADELVPGADPYIAGLVEAHARQLAAEQLRRYAAQPEPRAGGGNRLTRPARARRLGGVTVCVTP